MVTKKGLSLFIITAKVNHSLLNLKIMTTISNTTGSKAVNISERNDLGYTSVFAQYVQNYQGEQQVLQSKSFSTKAAAERWAKKIIA